MSGLAITESQVQPVACTEIVAAQAMNPQIVAVLAAIEENPACLIGALGRLSEMPGASLLPMPFIDCLARAIETGDWATVAASFVPRQFFGPQGHFLLTAPYTVRRDGGTQTRMSALYGQVLPLPGLPDLSILIRSLFGEMRQPVPVILPVTVLAGAGLFRNSSREAFIVPDGWAFPDSERGPSLNDMTEQRRRFLIAGEHCIRAIFEPESAELLLRPMREDREAMSIQHHEYSAHEAGHAAGIGLEVKLQRDLLTNGWMRAVEEWRSDGVAFELLSHFLPEADVARIICSNFLTRFGMDAHRQGGLEADTDVNATLLTFCCLLESGAIRIGGSGRLAFNHPSLTGLVQGVEMMRSEAVTLTRRELLLSRPEGLWGLYGSVPVSPAAVLLFRHLVVRPCQGFFTDLQ